MNDDTRSVLNFKIRVSSLILSIFKRQEYLECKIIYLVYYLFDVLL